MKEITILIPIHTYDDTIAEYLKKAVDSVSDCKKHTKTKLITTLVGPKEVLDKIDLKVDKLVNDGKTDFCSQINFGAKNCKTDYFSILEFDDYYKEKWFKMVNDYFSVNKDVSLFLPIATVHNLEDESYRFENEIIWASAFSNEIGFIDNDTLQHYYAFNVTGGVFNTKDFISVGMFKPSIEVSFIYELLLRMTLKELKIFVIPKEGYVHTLLREGSIVSENLKLSNGDVDKWYRLAKRESKYPDDREVSINTLVDEEVK